MGGADRDYVGHFCAVRANSPAPNVKKSPWPWPKIPISRPAAADRPDRGDDCSALT